MKKLRVTEIIGSKTAVSPEKGEILFREINNEISEKRNVDVDFSEVEDLTTAFLNKAIGNLYNKFTSDELNKYLKISGMDELDKYLLGKVITRAKLDIKTNLKLKESIDEVFGNE